MFMPNLEKYCSKQRLQYPHCVSVFFLELFLELAQNVSYYTFR